MPLRDELVTGLVRSLLGPQQGAAETLPAERDPRDEYITGVLAPRPAPGAPPAGAVYDIDADAERIEGDVDADEDEDDPAVIPPPLVFSPALDPRALPSS